ncbi:MAG: ABC transporter ATP-binding protein, partial [Chloroflexota bacterium]
ESFLRGVAPAILQLPPESNAMQEENWADNLDDEAIKNQNGYLVLLKANRRHLLVLGPDLSVHRVRVKSVKHVFYTPVEEPHLAWLEQFLHNTQIPEIRWSRVRQAVLNEQIGSTVIQGGWQIRLAPGTSLWKQARQIRLDRAVIGLLTAYAIQQILVVISWGVIGQNALSGHFERAWLWGWILLLFTAIPFQLWTISTQNRLAVELGGLFKQILIYGTMKIDLANIQHQGSGQFLGRVMESEAVERLSIIGGFAALLALIQVFTAMIVLSLGVAGWIHAVLLLIWLVVSLGLSSLYITKSMRWSDAYRDMTNDLVERMVGHRTRLVQEDRIQWHREEDRDLKNYFNLSLELDQLHTWLTVFISRGWMVIGFLGLVYGIMIPVWGLTGQLPISQLPMSQTVASPTAIAITLAGILLASQSLNSIVIGIYSVVHARIAWKQIAPIYQAAKHSKRRVDDDLSLDAAAVKNEQNDHPLKNQKDTEQKDTDQKDTEQTDTNQGETSQEESSQPVETANSEPLIRQLSLFDLTNENQLLVDQYLDQNVGRGDGSITQDSMGSFSDTKSKLLLWMDNVSYRYPTQAEPILCECTLRIYDGEHLLLQGPSGGGKSTLAMLLAGLHVPESGTLLLNGQTQTSLGLAEWRRRVAIVPQFYENHIFSATLAFNLLMGRRWPPLTTDLTEAEQICRELGLGELLDRMPAGLQQVVGENGWQLSHGERSRVYIARAILQNADFVIMDENFGTLDPKSMQMAMYCVQKRISTLLIIAHL